MELREGTQVVAMYEEDDKSVYYDARVLSAERREHGDGEGGREELRRGEGGTGTVRGAVRS